MKKTIKMFAASAVLAIVSMSAPSRAAVLFSDGDFSSWTTHAFHAVGANSGQTFFVSTSGGNPGGMFTAYSTRTDNGQVESAQIKEDVYTLSPLSGTCTLTFDYMRAAGAGTGFYGTGIAIRQGNKYWRTGDSAVNDKLTWTTSASTNSSINGSLSSFTPFIGTTGSPVLTGGVATYFGFFNYLNGPSTGIWGSSFDNLVLSTPNNSIVMTPEPVSIGFLCIGAMGLLARRRSSTDSSVQTKLSSTQTL